MLDHRWLRLPRPRPPGAHRQLLLRRLLHRDHPQRAPRPGRHAARLLGVAPRPRPTFAAREYLVIRRGRGWGAVHHLVGRRRLPPRRRRRRRTLTAAARTDAPFSSIRGEDER